MKLRSVIRARSFRIFTTSIAIQTVGYAVSMALMPIAIAFYHPADFGVFAIFFFTANLIANFGALKLDWAVINDPSSGAAQFAFRAGLTLTIIIAVVVTALWLAAPKSLYDHLGASRMAALTIAPMAVSVGLGFLIKGYAIRLKQYSNVYLGLNTTLISRQVFQIALGLIWPTVYSLLIIEFLCRATGIAISALRLRPGSSYFLPIWLNRRRLVAILRRYNHNVRYAVPSSFLNFITAEGLAVVVAALFGPAQAGAYWLTQRLFGVPIALMGSVAGDILQGEIAREKDAALVYRRTMRVAILLGALSLLIVPAAGVVIWYFTTHFYDGKWAESGSVALYLIPSICLIFVASPLGKIFIVKSKMNVKLWFDILVLGLLSAWAIATYVMALPFLTSIQLFAACQAIAYGFYLFLSIRTAKQP